MSKFPEKNQTEKINDQIPGGSLSSSLAENISVLKETFSECDDIIFQSTTIENQPACLVYLSEMVNDHALIEIEQSLYSPGKGSLDTLFNKQPPFGSVTQLNEWKKIIEQILSGRVILVIEQIKDAISFRSSNSKGRDVTEPDTDRTVKGPKEGFVEDIGTNMKLIRRKIRNPSLKVEHLTLGKQTNTQISVVYIKGIADDGIVQEVHQRLSRIDIDGVLDSQYLESMIKDSPGSPFPTVISTDRPDRVCGDLLDGKVAVVTDGSPFALTTPATFVEFLHSAEDYYDSSLASSIIRWVRFFGMFVALILPAFFVGLVTFHQDLLQTSFLIRIAANREALPYPALIEAIFMMLAYELVREAGLRMPKAFGGPVFTILGLLLIAQIAVRAGIVGPVMACVVSATALISFVLPNYAFHQVIRFSGILLLLLAGFFGFMGIIVGLMFGLAHLVS
ncbi:MAG TPA: spore germination protein, partial [Bacillales bacterium]|nr:spore germination protein [Bacillales bacterium]